MVQSLKLRLVSVDHDFYWFRAGGRMGTEGPGSVDFETTQGSTSTRGQGGLGLCMCVRCGAVTHIDSNAGLAHLES